MSRVCMAYERTKILRRSVHKRLSFALSETIRIMQEIDEVIESHGGWPGAFDVAAKRKADTQVQAI